MSEQFIYDYERPSITADCIVIYENKILLIKRKNDPDKGMYALPGGYLDPKKDESIFATASRELLEETGLTSYSLEFFKYYDAIDRDPRDRVVTFVFSKEFNTFAVQKLPEIKAGDDADNAEWIDIEDLWFLNLAFDHKKILKDYFNVKVLNGK
jgi:8-oxo-dGTP diphosphatase